MIETNDLLLYTAIQKTKNQLSDPIRYGRFVEHSVRPADIIDDWQSPLRFQLIHHRRIRKIIFIVSQAAISQIMPILRYLKDTNDQRPAVLLYFAEDGQNNSLPQELEQLPRHVKIVRLQKTAGRTWAGQKGCLTQQTIQFYCKDFLSESHVFLCGPDAMIREVQSSLMDWGVKEGRICFERILEPQMQHAE